MCDSVRLLFFFSSSSGDQVIRENPASRGTETSAEVRVSKGALSSSPDTVLLCWFGDQHSGIVRLFELSRQCSLPYLLTYTATNTRCHAGARAPTQFSSDEPHPRALATRGEEGFTDACGLGFAPPQKTHSEARPAARFWAEPSRSEDARHLLEVDAVVLVQLEAQVLHHLLGACGVGCSNVRDCGGSLAGGPLPPSRWLARPSERAARSPSGGTTSQGRGGALRRGQGGRQVLTLRRRDRPSARTACRRRRRTCACARGTPCAASRRAS